MASALNPELSKQGISATQISQPLQTQAPNRADLGGQLARAGASIFLSSQKKKATKAAAVKKAADTLAANKTLVGVENEVTELQDRLANANIFQASVRSDSVKAANLALDGISDDDKIFIKDVNARLVQLKQMQSSGVLNSMKFNVNVRKIKTDALLANPNLRSEIGKIFTTVGLSKTTPGQGSGPQDRIKAGVERQMTAMYGENGWSVLDMGRAIKRAATADRMDQDFKLGRRDALAISSTIVEKTSILAEPLLNKHWTLYMKQGFLDTGQVEVMNMEFHQLSVTLKKDLASNIASSLQSGNLLTQEQQSNMYKTLDGELDSLKAMMTDKDLLSKSREMQEMIKAQIDAGTNGSLTVLKELATLGGDAGLQGMITMVSGNSMFQQNLEALHPGPEGLGGVSATLMQELILNATKGITVADPQLAKVQQFLSASWIKLGGAPPAVEKQVLKSFTPEVKDLGSIKDSVDYLSDPSVADNLLNSENPAEVKAAIFNTAESWFKLLPPNSFIIDSPEEGLLVMTKMSNGGSFVDMEATKALQPVADMLDQYAPLTGGSSEFMTEVMKPKDDRGGNLSEAAIALDDLDDPSTVGKGLEGIKMVIGDIKSNPETKKVFLRRLKGLAKFAKDDVELSAGIAEVISQLGGS